MKGTITDIKGWREKHGEVRGEDGHLYHLPAIAIKRYFLNVGDEVTFEAQPKPSSDRLPVAFVTTRPLKERVTISLDDLIRDGNNFVKRLKKGDDFEIQPFDSDEAQRFLEQAALDLAREGPSAWLLDVARFGAHALARPDSWNHLVDRAIILGWLHCGDTGLLKEAANRAATKHEYRKLTRTLHLAAHPDNQRGFKFLYHFCGTLPDIEVAPKLTITVGWFPVKGLARAKLPEDYTWDEIVGRPQVRWIIRPGKGGSVRPPQRPGVSPLHDFTLVIVYGNQDEIDQESLWLSYARRGLRAAIILLDPVEDDMECAAVEVVEATKLCLQRNVDVYLSRSVKGEAFFGRKHELSRITDTIAAGVGVVLTGTRKVGKSSLASQFASLMTNKSVSLVDLNRHASFPYEEETLAQAVSHTLWWRESPLTRFSPILDTLRTRASGDRPCLVIDEIALPFETARLQESAVGGALAFGNFLRTVLEEQLLNIVACSPRQTLYSQPFLTIAGGEVDNPLLQTFWITSLKGLEDDSAHKLLHFYARRSMVKLSDTIAARITEACGGFPLALRATLHRATNNRKRPLTLSLDDIESALAPSSDSDSPWHIVRSTMWQWAIEWAPEHMRALLDGKPMQMDDIGKELIACGLVDDRGHDFAFPLLATVAMSHREDLEGINR